MSDTEFDLATAVRPTEAPGTYGFDVAAGFTVGPKPDDGTLRLKVVTAMAPHIADAVITGHDREEIGLLLFPTPQAKALEPATLRNHVHLALRALAAEGAGSSQTPTRALLQDEPPNADAGEITDKGYINQRAVLTRRAADVAALYSGKDARVIRG